ncbi:MAG: hypothetical protein IJ607_08270 [Bacteroidaceae bacterium]|nr:hypothetical protein [Bacteroidaceae bacterium]
MTKTRFFLTLLVVLGFQAVDTTAQTTAKELVVVIKQNYTYDDPRWNTQVTLEKGEAITVMDHGGSSYEFWPYPAADVSIPKKVTRLPGSAGEHYLVINGTNVRLRKGPSTNYGYYCTNVASGASVYHNQFISDKNKPKEDEWGLKAQWEPYYLPKGTRLPYLGKQNGFYKTKFNSQVFYISAKFTLLK